MSRVLIVLGLTILTAGLLWPLLARLGLGRLPGDIVVQRDGVTFYLPLTTCLILSIVLSIVVWLTSR